MKKLIKIGNYIRRSAKGLPIRVKASSRKIVAKTKGRSLTKAKQALAKVKSQLPLRVDQIKESAIEHGFVINKKGGFSKTVSGTDSSVFIGKTNVYGQKIPYYTSKNVKATVHNHPQSRLTTPSPQDLDLDLRNNNVGIVVAKDGTKHVYRRGKAYDPTKHNLDFFENLLNIKDSAAYRLAESHPDFNKADKITQAALRASARISILQRLNQKKIIRYNLRDIGKFHANPNLGPYNVDIKNAPRFMDWKNLFDL